MPGGTEGPEHWWGKRKGESGDGELLLAAFAAQLPRSLQRFMVQAPCILAGLEGSSSLRARSLGNQRGSLSREAAVAESQSPLWERRQEGGIQEGGWGGGRQQGFPPPPLFKEPRSQTERKDFASSHSGSSVLLGKEKRQGWKGTPKKVRFMPRELKHLKSQSKSAVNVFGRNMLPRILEPGLLTLLIILRKKKKYIYCNEGHKMKGNSSDLPSPAFLIHTFTFFLKHCHTSLHGRQNAVFPLKPFSDHWNDTWSRKILAATYYPIHLFNIHLLHARRVLGIFLDTEDKVKNKDTNPCFQGAYIQPQYIL